MSKITDAKVKNIIHLPDNECVYSPRGEHDFVTKLVCKHCGKWQEMTIARAKKKSL